MSLMNFLNKAFEKYQEYAPKLAAVAQEIDGYKGEYAHLSNRELVNELNKEKSGPRRAAISMLLKERGCERDSDGVWRRR